MNPFSALDNSSQPSATADIDMLVDAALWARAGTYIYPLSETMCDNR